MMNRGKKISGGGNQVNVGLTDEQLALLQQFIQIKGLRTVQDGVRHMVSGCKDFVSRELKKSKPAMPPAATAVATPTIGQHIAAPEDAPITSDDGMSPPSVIKSPDLDVDEDGEELSDGEKLRRARAQPTIDMVEAERWSSLKGEV
jgi:hypothetical protein